MLRLSDGTIATIEQYGVRLNRTREYADERGNHSDLQTIFIEYKDLDRINSDIQTIKDKKLK